jgi:hypothetical protein
MFWLWFLAQGHSEITLPVDDSEVILKAEFWVGNASFGIPADKKSLIEIIAAEHDVDWEDLEAAASADSQEEE